MIHAVSKIRPCRYQFFACIDTSAKAECPPWLKPRSRRDVLFSLGCRQRSGICATLVLFSRQRGLTHAYAQSHVSGCFSFGYVNGCLLQSCHDTGCHIATKCVSNDGLCEVKRCQSGVDHLQACKHVCKQVSK